MPKQVSKYNRCVRLCSARSAANAFFNCLNSVCRGPHTTSMTLSSFNTSDADCIVEACNTVDVARKTFVWCNSDDRFLSRTKFCTSLCLYENLNGMKMSDRHIAEGTMTSIHTVQMDCSVLLALPRSEQGPPNFYLWRTLVRRDHHLIRPPVMFQQCGAFF